MAAQEAVRIVRACGQIVADGHGQLAGGAAVELRDDAVADILHIHARDAVVKQRLGEGGAGRVGQVGVGTVNLWVAPVRIIISMPSSSAVMVGISCG